MSRGEEAIVASLLTCVAAALLCSGCDGGGMGGGGYPVRFLSLETGGLGTITLTPPDQDFGSSANAGHKRGTVVTIEITPLSGYAFVRIDWDDGSQTFDNPCQVTMDRHWSGTVVLEPL